MINLRGVKVLLIIAVTFLYSNGIAQTTELWSHLPNQFEFPESKGVSAKFIDEGSRTLQIIYDKPSDVRQIPGWLRQGRTSAEVMMPGPLEGWELNQVQNIEVQVINTGTTDINFNLWARSKTGIYDGFRASTTLKVGESKTVTCNIRATYPDGTPKLDPERIARIQFALIDAELGAQIELRSLQGNEPISTWKAPKGQLVVPEMIQGMPKAGDRVWYQPESVKGSNIYVALYLPINYKLGKKHPIIVEFMGDGMRPEHGVMGYGMSKGKDAIWIGMPFVNDSLTDIAEKKWGNPDKTADFTVKTVEEIVEKFNGDKTKAVITGFSRGAIACGYIGLRNDTIAALWSGIHACQHYDGDNWNGASLEGAKERIKRFKGKYFLTDNNDEEPRKMLKEANVDAIFTTSGLGAHSPVMFLDNRESTLQLRKWYYQLISDEN